MGIRLHVKGAGARTIDRYNQTKPIEVVGQELMDRAKQEIRAAEEAAERAKRPAPKDPKASP